MVDERRRVSALSVMTPRVAVWQALWHTDAFRHLLLASRHSHAVASTPCVTCAFKVRPPLPSGLPYCLS